MKLFIVFGLIEDEMVEALLCWDEYQVDENPQGWEEACEDMMKTLEPRGYKTARVIHVEVDGDKILRLLRNTPVVEGKIIE